ncbi:MAG: AMP-binding protein [Burkholderiaceae bacterium]|nr:AMP-binding protein [Burkholderiaceae bacterium]
MFHPSLHAKNAPDRIAYRMAESGETVSYGQLDEASNRFAQLLRASGVGPGEHIALMVENHPRFYEICWGAQRSGVIFTAISTRLSAEEAAYIVNDCGAKLFVGSRKLADVCAKLPALTAAVRRWLMLDGTVDGFESWEAAMAAQPAVPVDDEVAGSDMLYSSGTTGRPKGVAMPFEREPIDAISPLLEVTRKVYGMDESTVYLSPAPLYHAAPLRFNMSVMRLGGTCVIMEHFDPQRYLELVEQRRITHTQVVPTMFVRMLKLPEEVRSRYDVSSLKCAVHAAAPCPIPVKQQMIEWWGPILWEYYAGTEGNGMTLVGSQEWLTHPGTVGRAVIGKLRICDDDGNELPVGEQGTIYFSDGRDFKYHNDPEKTAQSRNAKGWTTLGDVGYIDEEGFLYLTDRKAFMIISGGVNIYPQEAENLLVMHPKVADVAVFGVPNEEFGEEVKAVVQPRDMRDASPELAAELIAWCRERLAHIKCPKTVDFEEELPRAATGKLYKRQLRDRYWEGRATKI